MRELDARERKELERRRRDEALDRYKERLKAEGVRPTAATHFNAYRAIRWIQKIEGHMANQIMQYFAYDHLPEELQEPSRAVAELAEQMDAEIPDGAEKSAGLRKLLEAKDCFVRAKLDAPAGPGRE